ncbi:iron-containing alcohol dehydrogenase [Piscibacillus halophilus]|uniref:Alcohol dehydrogenase, class IV n=1 Tax=Piscibacillus halophilus TaxID=571933 RepID=A0A1H9CJU3_9BACI|nr:iron-containing alcohol dehydrogenase [Piscibacillus halophilus]SEQ00878.1 Alcohol dehydrogenase, class IV [Piscibacillus halophilus]
MMQQFITPKNIYHGKGSIQKLEDIFNEMNVKKVFMLTDPILKELNVIEPIVEIVERNHLDLKISTNVVPEPPLKVGNDVVNEVKTFNPDLVIGVGGGSSLDLAKASAILSTHEGDVEDYLNLTGTKELTNEGVPTVLIPTTAGTGAEVTDIAVFSLKDTKDVITHKYLLANYAIVDPVLTYTLPPKVTAASGIDALTHAIEAYTSVNATPITDTLAVEAMKKIVNNIRSAVWNNHDYKARDEMANGSLIAGLSFYNAGVAGVHGLAYPLGGLFKIPHGESNAVLLPYVYNQIWPATMDKMYSLYEVFDIPVEGKTKREVVKEIVQALYDLVVDVGLATSIAEYNIKEEDIETLTQNGLKQERLLKRSPMKFDEALVRKVYEHAYKGW